MRRGQFDLLIAMLVVQVVAPALGAALCVFLLAQRAYAPAIVLLMFVIVCLVASPLVFLIKEVRNEIALRIAALAIVGVSYLATFMLFPFLMWMILPAGI